jgi:hypothetical protein
MGDGTENDPTQEPQAPSNEPTEPQGDGGQSFTQDDIDEIVEKRLARERAKYEQKLEEERKKREEWKKQQERQKLEEKEEYKKLYEETQQQLESTKSEYEQKLTQQQRQVAQERARSQLLKAAQSAGAVAPDHVVAILQNRVTVDEDGQVKVVDENGEIATDGKGNALSPEALAQNFVDEHPHFQRAAGGKGGGGRPNGGSKPGGDDDFDVDRFKSDVDYAIENADKAEKGIRDGKYTA